MLDYLIQNFNWPTFFLALAFFIIVASVVNLIKAYFLKIKAEADLKLAEKKLSELQAQMKAKEEELEKILEGGGKNEPR
ncbi:MAG: hypothetical protein ACPL4K_02570, partial [Candidatus Margulisiibacteriota bacterium]